MRWLILASALFVGGCSDMNPVAPTPTITPPPQDHGPSFIDRSTGPCIPRTLPPLVVTCP
jgi:hypothetical protein